MHCGPHWAHQSCLSPETHSSAPPTHLSQWRHRHLITQAGNLSGFKHVSLSTMPDSGSRYVPRSCLPCCVLKAALAAHMLILIFFLPGWTLDPTASHLHSAPSAGFIPLCRPNGETYPFTKAFKPWVPPLCCVPSHHSPVLYLGSSNMDTHGSSHL